MVNLSVLHGVLLTLYYDISTPLFSLIKKIAQAPPLGEIWKCAILSYRNFPKKRVEARTNVQMDSREAPQPSANGRTGTR